MYIILITESLFLDVNHIWDSPLIKPGNRQSDVVLQTEVFFFYPDSYFPGLIPVRGYPNQTDVQQIAVIRRQPPLGH